MSPSLEKFLTERELTTAFFREEVARWPRKVVDKSHADEWCDEILAEMPDLAETVATALRLDLIPEARQLIEAAITDFAAIRPECSVGAPQIDDLTRLIIVERYGAEGTDAGMHESIRADIERAGVEGRRRLCWQILRERRERGEPFPDFGDDLARPVLKGFPAPRIVPTPKREPRPVPHTIAKPQPFLRAQHR